MILLYCITQECGVFGSRVLVSKFEMQPRALAIGYIVQETRDLTVHQFQNINLFLVLEFLFQPLMSKGELLPCYSEIQL